MSASRSRGEVVDALETLMLDHFRSEPFHNLHAIYGPSIRPDMPGGTCFYKTGRLVDIGRNSGFDVHWHTASVRVQGVPWPHWVVRVQVDGRRFFADMGNGWPSIKLYPADLEVAYRHFGMGFRTEIANERVTVFHEKHGKESVQLEIDVRPKPEAQLLAEVERRSSLGHIYPINRLRFSLIVGSRFLFLRGDRLEIYDDNGFECLEGIDDARVREVLRDHFGYDVGALPSVDNLRPRVDRSLEGAEQSDEHVASSDHGSAGESTMTKDGSEGAGCHVSGAPLTPPRAAP